MLFQEKHPIVSLTLDSSDDNHYLWVSTTNSDINKWVSPGSGEGEEK